IPANGTRRPIPPERHAGPSPTGRSSPARSRPTRRLPHPGPTNASRCARTDSASMTSMTLDDYKVGLLVVGVALLGAAWLPHVLGYGMAAALLLGAVLAPTDPVLATDLQVGAPGEGGEDPVRFTLTSEAGLNDGLAFPFVWLALAFAGASIGGSPDWARWLGI